jgi:hypothetical protein
MKGGGKVHWLDRIYTAMRIARATSCQAGSSTSVTGSNINNQLTDRCTYHIFGARDAGMVRRRVLGSTFRCSTRIGSASELQVSSRCQDSESTCRCVDAAQLRLRLRLSRSAKRMQSWSDWRVPLPGYRCPHEGVCRGMVAGVMTGASSMRSRLGQLGTLSNMADKA